jgi:hypothetical protein
VTTGEAAAGAVISAVDATSRATAAGGRAAGAALTRTVKGLAWFFRLE